MVLENKKKLDATKISKMAKKSGSRRRKGQQLGGNKRAIFSPEKNRFTPTKLVFSKKDVQFDHFQA